MKIKPFLFLMLLLEFISCDSQELQTVSNVDLKKYSGLWYDIAHLPVSFMKGCECTTAEYILDAAGTVKVVNKCKKAQKGIWKSAKAKAFVVPNSGNSKLKVQFFWPFKGDYWIIDLDDEYQYAVVGNQSRKYLWILSRTPKMDQKLLDQIIIRTGKKGFAIGQLEFSRHSSCE